MPFFHDGLYHFYQTLETELPKLFKKVPEATYSVKSHDRAIFPAVNDFKCHQTLQLSSEGPSEHYLVENFPRNWRFLKFLLFFHEVVAESMMSLSSLCDTLNEIFLAQRKKSFRFLSGT